MLTTSSVLQVTAYIKRNKRRVRGCAEINTVGDILSYAKDNNFLKMLMDEPNLGQHHRGAILIYRGQYLGADNQWLDLPHRERHEAEQEQDFSVPGAFGNLLSNLSDAALSRAGPGVLGSIIACVQECLAVAEGISSCYPATN